MALKRRIALGLLIIALISLAVLAYFWPGVRDVTAPSHSELSSAIPERDLHETVLVPSWTSPLPEGKNALWCATFQMAWDRLKEDVIKAPIRVQGAEKISGLLNDNAFPKDGIDPEFFYAAAGDTEKGIVEKIRADMKTQFPDYALRLDGVPENAFLAYAYLRASVTFKIPYFDNDAPLKFTDASGRAHSLKSFGLRPKDGWSYDRMRAQAAVLFTNTANSWEPPLEFAIDPCVTSTPHQLILAKIKRKDTLAETWSSLSMQLKEPTLKLRLVGNDIFLAPNIRLSTLHHFQELEGPQRRILNPGFEACWIEKAWQSIQFTLDRGGARVSSEARGDIPKALPRQLIFDGPFLVVLRKRGAKDPFFILWIENPEVLVTWP